MNIITEYATAINKVDFFFGSEYAKQAVWGHTEKETIRMAYDNLVSFFTELHEDSIEVSDKRLYFACVEYCYIQIAKIDLGKIESEAQAV